MNFYYEQWLMNATINMTYKYMNNSNLQIDVCLGQGRKT